MTIRVLVVDDSAFARKVVREILSRSEGIEVVGVARDGLDALEKIEQLSPDVITLDLVMPHLDGLGVLAAMRVERAPRVVVISTASDDSETVVAALQAGAISSVRKPTALATDRLYDMATEVVEAVRRAAAARWTVLPPARNPPAPPTAPARIRLLVIGASTGGPQALTALVSSLPARMPVPVCIVLHMPVGYTEAFARRLHDGSEIDVAEAAEGMPLRPGLVIVAQAGLHLSIGRSSGSFVARLDTLPLDRPHRPSVDVLFRSAAKVAGNGVLGVVLTGMGDDGTAGSGAVVAAGGRVITQSAATCVVYGMPRSVVEAGFSDEAVDIGDMPAAILRRL